MKKYTCFSAFSGIGAFEKGFDRIGQPYELYGYCEIDKYASKSYALIHNTDERMNYGDITKIDETKIEKDLDFFTYGFPCQDISLAGNQKGLVDENGGKTRSGLVWDATRIIKASQPKIAIAENVKNLVGKKFTNEFQAILKELEECGYNNYWKVLNAKEYGVAQNRDRVFIVSIRKDVDTGLFKWPEKETLTKRLLDYLEDEVDEKYLLNDNQVKRLRESTFTQAAKSIHDPNGVVSTLLARDYKDPKAVDLSLIQVGQLYGTEKEPNPQAGRIYSPEGIAPTLDSMQGGNRMPKIAITKKTGTPGAVVSVQQIENGVIIDDTYANRKPRVYDKYAPSLRAGREGLKTIHLESNDEHLVRKLTPKECFRLMGFDDEDHDVIEAAGISNSQRYKMAGNSIVVDVVAKILKALIEQLKEL